MSGVNEIRSTFLNFFADERPRNRAVVAARAAQRPDLDVHQCRHGAVQERLYRRREAALSARHHLAEMRARRRQAQRPRQCRLHRAASHLLRDARQFLVRRLLQGPRDRAGLESGHQGVRPAEGQAARRPSISTTTRRSISGRRSRACRSRASSASPAPTISGRWATPARAGRARKSSTTTATRSGAARRARRRPDGDRFIEIWNLVFMQFEQLEGGVRNPLPKPSIDTGAGLERVAAVLQGKHDNYDIDLFVALIRAIAELTGADPQGRAEGLAARDRRSSARVVVPDRRRRAALERRPRLCAAPDHAPRDAPCAVARRQGSADASAGLGAGARDGPGLSGTGARRKPDRGNAAAGRDALPQDAGARAVDPRREERLP